MQKILFICGSVNQTTMMHKISQHLESEYECYFTPYYTDGFKAYLVDRGLLDFTILGGNFRKKTEGYLQDNKLKLDYKGMSDNYDLVVTCTDLIIQKNIKRKKIILVQEGMTDPENIFFLLSKYLNFPRYLASTSATGLSHAYASFCVASEGYRDLFIKKGCNPEKIRVTGIPNFDNCRVYTENGFPHRDYVLVCTSDTRETFRYENRKRFIENAVKIAEGKQLIFKLHPNENHLKAEKEIKEVIPSALVFADGNTNEMIANCKILITKYSSVVYVGIALGKEVYSDFKISELTKKAPLQNNGSSAKNIAAVCEYHLSGHREREFRDAQLIPATEQY